MDNVKRYRLFAGFSQVDLAKKTGISLGSYRAKEQGRVHFSDKEKLAIKSAISKRIGEVSIDDIFFKPQVQN